MNSLILTSPVLNKAQQYFQIIAILFLAACQLDPVFDDDIERFNKIYSVTQNVEAIDVVEKMDGSGYLILGHVKTTSDSDIILIDAGLDGMQRNYQRIDTDKYDEAVALRVYQEEQSIYILGNRRENSNTGEYSNILIKASLDGNPIQVENDTTSYTEVKLLESVDNYSIKMNDFLINPPYLIFTGQINQSGSNVSNKFNQIYNIQSFNFNITAADDEVDKLHQIPLSLSSLTPNTRNLHIDKSDFPGAIYTVYGQADELTDQVAKPTWEIFTDLETQTGLNPDLKAETNLEYGFALNHSNKKAYFAGNIEGINSLFLISAEYTNTETSIARIELNDSIKGDGQNEFLGSPKVSSMLEDLDGNIIMAVYVEEQSNSTNSISYLLKFSPSKLQIEDQLIVFNSTGQNNIKKVILASDGSVLLLSQLNFENNSMAIGLTKIKF